ncbi:ATP-dependent DNA ligase [Enemella dayhoffiae]|uniref:DNA ligase (ATP) n=1 Tax=Enemella dayhoffiae TaxID=2016507 RepID=A0A255H4Y0_9ACTN|nr:ATP-dependent DNA ligase [Enemella dayhoffiae]OYO22681.1 ATP-dependent DNA ligase [Enemella dayhoffiae]
MVLPLQPPVKPMLAKSVPNIPADRWYEPKWDGFRSIVFVDGGEVVLGSRNEKPLTRYFPELVATLTEQLAVPCVLDGEIVVVDPSAGRLEFEVLQQRIHPAVSRITKLSQETPASFVAFDLLALGDRDLSAEPFRVRRKLLAELFADLRPPLHLTPLTTDLDEGQRWFDTFEGAGLDGVIAKDPEQAYQPDKRVMAKIKHVRTADCVVAGYRTHKNDPEGIGSLLLGVYDEDGNLHSLGVIGSFPAARRKELYAELQPLVCDFSDHPWAWAAEMATRTPRSGEGSRWNNGKDLSFTPLRPELVVEAKYDYLEGKRFRHTAQFVRWRPDRDPKSCTFDQLEQPVKFDLADVLGA